MSDKLLAASLTQEPVWSKMPLEAKTIGAATLMTERATITDVAERSGVSITTVSHVLNEVPGKRVNATTRARVQRAADELLYSPNRLARGLRTQRTQMIGFLSDRVSTTPFAGQMIVGAQDAAAEAGSLLVLLNSGGDPELEEREVQALRERQVDGIVYALFYHRVVTPPASLPQRTGGPARRSHSRRLHEFGSARRGRGRPCCGGGTPRDRSSQDRFC